MTSASRSPSPAAGASPVPIEVRRLLPDQAPPHGGMALQWNDGKTVIIPNETLRRNCPCATCIEARGDTSHAKPLTGARTLLKVIDAPLEDSLRLDEIWPVGNYALGMRWGDGHETGIYTFAFLRDLVTGGVPASAA